jgi:diacylglycerol kinase family enzyme
LTSASQSFSLNRVVAVVNTASGGVTPGAAALLREIGLEFDLPIEVVEASPAAIVSALRAAIRSTPDLLIVLAGDGTAAVAADLCGMEGPLLAPLAGGTMNMLPHALYGRRPWPDALRETLAHGRPRVVACGVVACGVVAGRRFYVAAILGAPALWAHAREAMRKRRFRLAFLRARHALAHALSGRLRFALDDGVRRKAQALTLMCPLVSRALDSEQALEAAALDPRGAADAFRLGLSTLFGRWRQDSSVSLELCATGRAWARGRIPAILDGEPHRLESPVEIRFQAAGFRAFAPPPIPDPAIPASPLLSSPYAAGLERPVR